MELAAIGFSRLAIYGPTATKDGRLLLGVGGRLQSRAWPRNPWLGNQEESLREVEASGHQK